MLAWWGIELDGRSVGILGSDHGRLAASLARRGARVLMLDSSGLPRGPSREGVLRVQSGEQALPLPDGSLELLVTRHGQLPSEWLRVLRPGGWCVHAGFDWVLDAPGPGLMAERALCAFGLRPDPERAHGPAGSWLAAQTRAGLEDLRSASLDQGVAYDRARWRSVLALEIEQRGSLDEENHQRLWQELDEQLPKAFPVEPMDIPHRLFLCAGRRPQWKDSE